MSKKTKLLFVCTSGYRASNLIAMLNLDKNYETKAIGVSNSSEKEIQSLIDWADKVLCISDEHFENLKENFRVGKNMLFNLNSDSFSSQKDFLDFCKKIISS